MTKPYLPLLIALTLASCSANTSADGSLVGTVKQADSNQQENAPANNLLADTMQVKRWLTNVIESYTNSNDTAANLNAAYSRMLNALTDDYYNYKLDAMYLDSDRQPPMSKEQFKKKWEGKYNTKYAGFGGFIISAQDNGNVKVTSCNLLSGNKQDSSVYRVLIEDLDYKAKYNRDIKVIARNGRLFIDDIREYN